MAKKITAKEIVEKPIIMEPETLAVDQESGWMWKYCDNQTMVANLPTGCIVAFEGHGMTYVPNVRWEDGKFQRSN